MSNPQKATFLSNIFSVAAQETNMQVGVAHQGIVEGHDPESDTNPNVWRIQHRRQHAARAHKVCKGLERQHREPWCVRDAGKWALQ